MAGGKWQTVFVNSYNTAPLLPTDGWPCPPRHLQLLQPETYSMEKIELFATDSCKENYCGSGNQTYSAGSLNYYYQLQRVKKSA